MFGVEILGTIRNDLYVSDFQNDGEGEFVLPFSRHMVVEGAGWVTLLISMYKFACCYYYNF